MDTNDEMYNFVTRMYDTLTLKAFQSFKPDSEDNRQFKQICEAIYVVYDLWPEMIERYCKDTERGVIKRPVTEKIEESSYDR